MKTKPYDGPIRVGSIRPSQVVYSYGVGSLVDLPNLSVMVSGLDIWDPTHQEVITEERLLGAVRARLGLQVQELRALPTMAETTKNPFDEWARVGVPVKVFPRWLRCTRCRRLFPVSSGALKLDSNPYRPDQAAYVHTNCDKAKRPSPAVPARFVAGCANGHLDEFPWVQFSHDGVAICGNPILQVNDIGTGGRATDLLVKCLTCNSQATLAKAFGPAALTTMPQCRGRHPHLGLAAEPCAEQLRTLVLGASNLWFGSNVSALSLPVGGGSLAQLVHDHWADLDKMPVKDVLAYALGEKPLLKVAFAGYDLDEIWSTIEARRAGDGAPISEDVLAPEWTALVNGSAGALSPHFESEPIAAPPAFVRALSGVTLAHRLRVVTALCGFSRISAPDPGDAPHLARLETTGKPTWIPVVENRGEGIFIHLDERAVQAWEAQVDQSEPIEALHAAYRRFREARNADPSIGWQGARLLLLHSLSHALINELAIRCGYSSASISERIYSRRPGDGPEPMAGILLYTSAPDAEGTLGGLVELGKPAELGSILANALERARLCSSDPLCAEHQPGAVGEALHGAACHGCLLVAETSCQLGNRYLDRATLIETFQRSGVEFFP